MQTSQQIYSQDMIVLTMVNIGGAITECMSVSVNGASFDWQVFEVGSQFSFKLANFFLHVFNPAFST